MATCRCTCTAYGGSCDCRFDGRTQGTQDERVAVVAYLRALSRDAGWISAELALEQAADAIERGEHRKPAGR